MKTNQTKELTLFDKEKETLSRIRFDEEMVSLTDLWKEVGSPANQTGFAGIF